MPDFVNPFSGNVPDRKLTNEELIRALRLNIAAEYEAIFLYMAHAEATDHPLAKKVLVDVANEEREHVGEFQRLIEILTGDEEEYVSAGREEVDEMVAEVSGTSAEGSLGEQGAQVGHLPGEEEATIGSLK